MNPSEIAPDSLRNVVLFLESPASVVASLRVCKHWARCIDDDLVWKEFSHRRGWPFRGQAFFKNQLGATNRFRESKIAPKATVVYDGGGVNTVYVPKPQKVMDWSTGSMVEYNRDIVITMDTPTSYECKVWNIARGLCLHSFKFPFATSAVCMNEEYTFLASTGMPPRVHAIAWNNPTQVIDFKRSKADAALIYRATAGDEKRGAVGAGASDGDDDEDIHHTSAVTCADMVTVHSKAGIRTIAASSGYDTTIRTWDPRTGEALELFTGHTAGVWSIAIRPDGKVLASGANDRNIRIWKLRDPTAEIDIKAEQEEKKLRLRREALAEIEERMEKARIKKDRESDSIFAPYYDSEEDEEEIEQDEQENLDKDVADEKKKKKKKDAPVRVSEACCLVLIGHTRTPMCLKFDPSAPTKYLYSAGYDNTCRRWCYYQDPLNPQVDETERCKLVFNRHTNAVLAMEVLNNVVVSGDRSGEVMIWDKYNGDLLQSIQAHQMDIKSIKQISDFSFVSVAYDGRMVVYEAKEIGAEQEDAKKQGIWQNLFGLFNK